MRFNIGMTPPGRDGRISFCVGWQPTPANGATFTFGRRPLSHALRPFIGSNPKVAFGSMLLVRRVSNEWPLFAHCGRARIVLGRSTAQSRDRVLLKHLAKALHVAFRLRRFGFALAYDAPRRDNPAEG
jgi:hypothetical protein